MICEYTLVREKNNLENCVSEKQNFEKNLQNQQNKKEIPKFPQFFIEEADILFYCQEFLLSLINCSFYLLNLIYTYPNLQKILSIGLILSDNPLLKEKFASGLNDLFKAYSVCELPLKPHEFFTPIFINHILEIAYQNEEKSEVFFNLLNSTLEETPFGNSETITFNFPAEIGEKYNFKVDLYELSQKLIVFIKETKNCPENTGKDIVLTCSLNLLRVLMNYLFEKAEEIGIDLGLVDEILLNCLFEIKKGLHSNNSSYKCKSYTSRMAAFNLLQTLSMKSDKCMKKVLDFFLPLLRESDWRTKSISDWNITPKFNEKSQTGYVGLKNLGCSKLFLYLEIF